MPRPNRLPIQLQVDLEERIWQHIVDCLPRELRARLQQVCRRCGSTEDGLVREWVEMAIEDAEDAQRQLDPGPTPPD